MSSSRACLLALALAGCASHAVPGAEPSPPAREPPPSAAPSAVSPAASAAPAPAPPSSPPRRPGSYANVDPDDELVVGPPDASPDCEAELEAAGVKFQASRLPVHTAPHSKIVCGAPQVVIYLRGPGKITYSSPPLVTCRLALALASLERIVQAEAASVFGSRVARIDHLGTYSCREMKAYPGWVSEHSYANAIDIGRFVLENGKSIEVLRDFDLGDGAPAKPAGVFLRGVSRRAFDEDVFSHVLTPFFDAIHKNHFHFDLARYRGDGTRPQGV